MFDPLELSITVSSGWRSVMVEPGDGGVPGDSPETLTVLSRKE